MAPFLIIGLIMLITVHNLKNDVWHFCSVKSICKLDWILGTKQYFGSSGFLYFQSLGHFFNHLGFYLFGPLDLAHVPAWSVLPLVTKICRTDLIRPGPLTICPKTCITNCIVKISRRKILVGGVVILCHAAAPGALHEKIFRIFIHR